MSDDDSGGELISQTIHEDTATDEETYLLFRQDFPNALREIYEKNLKEGANHPLTLSLNPDFVLFLVRDFDELNEQFPTTIPPSRKPFGKH